MRIYIQEATTDGHLVFITGQADGGQPLTPGWHSVTPLQTQVTLVTELRRLRGIIDEVTKRAEDAEDERDTLAELIAEPTAINWGKIHPAARRGLRD